MHAGLHEVIYTEQTKAAYEKAVSEDRITWRVSSTMFTMFRYNVDCTPLAELKHLYEESLSKDQAAFQKKYPKMSAFDILIEELNATNMLD